MENNFSPKELLFAKIALEQGFIQKENLQMCLSMKKGVMDSLSLEELFLQLRLMDMEKIKRVKQILYHRIRSQSTYTREDLEDSIFGRIAIQNKWMTQEQLRWALMKQRECEKEGVLKRLGEILVEAKILTTQQMVQLLNHQKKNILICPTCHSQYNLNNPKPNQRYQCKKCNALLEVPSQVSSAGVLSSIIDPPSAMGNPSALRKEEETVMMDPTPSTTKSQLANPHYGQTGPEIKPIRPSSLVIEGKGRAFGRYQILNQIARGGMGVVYKAMDVSLDRIVALKTLIGGEHASQEVIQRFLVEAKAAAKLRHPNIVAIHEVGNIEGLYFFTMDYIEGEPFNQVIHQKPPQNQLVQQVIKVCDAIDYAHSHHIIHRDLKPSNVIIDRAGEPQVMDFGLAKEVDSQTDLTQTGATIGTPSYMSPEQASGYTDQVDHRSDIYSLGSILYEALTFKKPFEGQTSMAIIYQVITQEPPIPRKINPGIPKDLETIVLKAMDKEKSRRYDTAWEMADDLRRYLQGEAIQARPASPFYKAWKKIRKNKISVAITAVFLLITLLLGGVFLLQYQKGQEAQKNLQVSSMLKEAEGQLKEGKLLRCQNILDQILALEPNHQRAHLYLAQIYRRNKEYEGAKKALQKILKGPSPLREACFEMGRIFEEEKGLSEALKWYSRAIEKNSSYVEAYERRKEIYKVLGKLDKALEDSKAIRQLRAKMALGDTARARKLLGQGQWTRALHFLNRAIAARPENPEAYVLRSRCHQFMEEQEKAIEDISKALSLASEKVEYYFRRAEILSHFGYLAKAILDYQKIIKLEPQSPKAHVRLGELYYKQKRNLYALSQYLTAEKKGAGSLSFYQGFASLYLRLRRFQKTLDYADRALKVKSDNLESFYTKGLAYFSLKDYPQSLQFFQRVYQKNKDPKIAQQIAQARIELKDYKGALQLLNQISLDFPALHYEKSRIFYGQKQFHRALQEIELALQGSHLPQSDYYELRGDILFELKEYRRALEDFGVAMDVDWRNFDCFYKFFYTTMAGFLWQEALGRVRGGKQWISEIVRRQWSYETSLFDPEEQEVLDRYYWNAEKTAFSSEQKISQSSLQDGLESLRSGIEDMEKIGKTYLLKLGQQALPYLEKGLSESSNQREKLLLKDLIDRIQKGSEEDEISQVSGYLVRIYINRDILARKKLFALGEKCFVLLKKILQNVALHPLLRLYALKEVYSTTDTKNTRFIESLIPLHNDTAVLASIAVAEAYQLSPSVKEALVRGIFSSDPFLRALALSKIPLSADLLPEIYKLLQSTRDPRIKLLCATKIFLFNGDQGALNMLVEGLQWEDPHIKIYLSQILSKSRDPRVLPHLRSLLKDRDSEVRLAGIIGLRLSPGDEIVEDLLRALKDPATEVRIHALVILDRLAKSERATSEFYNILKNPKENFHLRVLTFFSLKRLRDFSSLIQFATLLPKLAKDPNPLMRMIVVIGMGLALSNPKVRQFATPIIEVLKDGLKDEVLLVQGGSIMALGVIAEGQDYVDQFRANLDTHGNDMVGTSSAAALTIMDISGKVKVPGLNAKLRQCSPWIRKGAAYGYWYFSQDKNRRFLRGKDALPLSWERRERLLLEATELSPKYYYLYLDLAEMYVKKGYSQKARAVIETVLKVAPRSAKVLKEVANFYKELRDYQRALGIYDRWIKLYPNDYRPYYEKGNLLSPGEEKVKNLHYALLALSHPSTTDEFRHKRNILLRFGLVKEAWAVLEKGVMDSGAMALYSDKIRFLMEHRNYKKALEALEVVFRASKTPDQEMYFFRGICLMKGRKYREALEDFKYLWSRPHRDNLGTFKYTAYCLEKLGRQKEARKWYSHIVQKFSSGEAYCAMGMYYQRQDAYIKALAWFKKAPRDPFQPYALAHISINYALQENPARSIQYLKKAVEQGFKNKGWLQEQYGYQKALMIVGFKALVDALEDE